MKYIKKAIVIEAVLASTIIHNFTHEEGAELPDWAIEAMGNDFIYQDDTLIIQTPELLMTAKPEDMIVRGLKGELRPVKPDVFVKSYAPMNGPLESIVEIKDISEGAFTSIPESMGGHAEEETPPPIGNFPILKFFEFEHLPEHLQNISKPFHDLAYDMAAGLQPSAELSAGLRKLLEAKDCIVRASI